MSLPYYPMYPRDFHEGTLELSLEAKGAYIMVLNLIYTRGDAVSDEAGYISRYVGCSVRKWKQVRDELLAHGKLRVENGMIRNSRADEVLEKQRLYRDQQAENRANPNKNSVVKSPSKTTRALKTPEPKPEPEKRVEADASTGARPRRVSAKASQVWMQDDWELSADQLAWAMSPENTDNIQLTEPEIRREAHQFKRWFLDRRDAGDKRGLRPGFDRSWQSWISREPAKIVERRGRGPAAGAARYQSAAERAAQRDRDISAAFAAAALEACDGGFAEWEDPQHARPGERLRLVHHSGGDRGADGGAGAGSPQGRGRHDPQASGPLRGAGADRPGSPQGVGVRLDRGHARDLLESIPRGRDDLETINGTVSADAWPDPRDCEGDRAAYAKAVGRLL